MKGIIIAAAVVVAMFTATPVIEASASASDTIIAGAPKRK